MANAVYKHCGDISSKVMEGCRKGIPMKHIHASCMHLQQCPASLTTFIKIYKKERDEAKMLLSNKIASKFVEQIDKGNWKAIEFGMKGIVGVNPAVVVDEKDENEDESSTAQEILDSLFKKEDK